MRKVSMLACCLAGALIAGSGTSFARRAPIIIAPGVPMKQYEKDRRDCVRDSYLRERLRQINSEMMMQKCMATKGYVKHRDGNGYFHYVHK